MFCLSLDIVLLSLSACEKAGVAEGHFVLSDDGQTIVDETFMNSLPSLTCLEFVATGSAGSCSFNSEVSKTISESSDSEDGKFSVMGACST